MAIDNHPHMPHKTGPAPAYVITSQMMSLTVLVPSISSVPMNIVQPTNDVYEAVQLTDAPDSQPLSIWLKMDWPFLYCMVGGQQLWLTSLYEPPLTLYWQPDYWNAVELVPQWASSTVQFVSGKPVLVGDTAGGSSIGMVGTSMVLGNVGDPGFQQAYFVFTFAGPPPMLLLGGASHRVSDTAAPIPRPPRAPIPGPPRALGALHSVPPASPDTTHDGAGHEGPHSAAPAPECTHVISTPAGSLYFCPN